jgi:hypothetical protein
MAESDFNNLQKHVSKLTDKHNDLVQAVNLINECEAEKKQRKQFEIAKELMTHLCNRATAYNQIIIAAGYAIFFTVWKSVRGELNRTLMLCSGALVLLSAFLFIIHTVWNMVAQTSFFKKTIQQWNINAYGRWYWFFVPTVISGLIGGLILIIAFGYGLIVSLYKS